MIKKYKSFYTERLLLRAASSEDADLVYILLNTPKWKEFIGDRNVNNLDDAKRYIDERMIPQYERLGYGNYTMIRKADEVKMGFCGLYDREGLEGVDIGFAILPEFECKGYTYEAAKLMMDIGFNTIGLSMIQGITSKKNIASQALLKKLGLTFKGPVSLPDDEEEILLFQKQSDR